MISTLRTKTYVLCPRCCKGESRIDHLKVGDKAGPWYCDECGWAFTVEILREELVDVQMCDEQRIKTWDLLVLEPQDKSIYFVVPGGRFEGESWWQQKSPSDAEKEESKRFYYESHSCPTNWLRPEVMVFGDDTDPHGLIKFVRSVDNWKVPQTKYGSKQSWEWVETFPELSPLTAEEMGWDKK